MVINVLILTSIFLRLIIGIRLVILARQNNLPNINWLAIQFFLGIIILFFAPTDGGLLGNLSFSLWIFVVFSLLAQAAALAFIQKTFYQHRAGPIWWYVGATIVCAGFSVYGVALSKSNFAQHPLVSFSSICTFLIAIFLMRIAQQTLASLAEERSVEDWVKARYRLMGSYSAAGAIAAVGSFIRIAFVGGSAVTPLGTMMGALTLIAQIVAVILQFLVWVMPEGFRKWLNRNQQAHTKELVHQQALAMLDILGSAMSDGTGLSKMLALFTIRKTIGDEIHTEDQSQIEAYSLMMGFDAWSALLKNPELAHLIKISSVTADPRDVLEHASHALIEKQSLFTLQSR